MQRLYSKVTQLSSYHLTNKEVLYVHTADSQDNILPRGGPIRDPYPLSWKWPPHNTRLCSTKLHNEKVIQLHSHYTANKKIQYIQAIDVFQTSYSRIYASNAVGLRRVRVGRPEPEAD